MLFAAPLPSNAILPIYSQTPSQFYFRWVEIVFKAENEMNESK